MMRVLQAHRLMGELGQSSHLVLNMTNSLADRAESGVAVTLPYQRRLGTSLRMPAWPIRCLNWFTPAGTEK